MDQGRPASPPPHGLSRGPRIWSLPGPWTRQVVRGTVLSWSFSRGPCVWSAEWTVVCQGGSTMTVRPYMVLRVGRMIGPACGPLVHSHDVDRKRAGHVGGPPASTWSIWPLVQGPGLRPWPTRRGLIVDRAVLDGPWSWLTPSSASDRPVRPTADTRRLRQDLFILRVAPR